MALCALHGSFLPGITSHFPTASNAAETVYIIIKYNFLHVLNMTLFLNPSGLKLPMRNRVLGSVYSGCSFFHGGSWRFAPPQAYIRAIHIALEKWYLWISSLVLQLFICAT